MPETSRGLRYPSTEDDAKVPKDLQNLAEDTTDALDAIGLDQLVVPGSSDGKLLIVKDGAAAYKAMSGDGTIDEDGVFQLGSKVVGTSELGDKSVTGAKVDDGTLADSKLASPNNAVYRALLQAHQPLSVVAGKTYLLANAATPVESSGNFLEKAVPLLGLDNADYEVVGKTPKLRLRALVAANATKPGPKFTFSLFPVTLAGAGSALTITLGTAVAGSSVEIAPAASAATPAVSGDFAVPADGAYALGVALSSNLGSTVLTSAQLQIHHT